LALTDCLPMKSRVMEQRLRREAEALLEQGKVDWIIGFEAGSLRFTTTPLITDDKDDTKRLVVSPFANNNLSVYLTGIKGRVAIVAKGCDSRSIVSLIQDGKVARQDVVIIGVPCSGIIDLAKVEGLVGRDRDEIDDIVREGDKVSITFSGDKREYPAGEVLFDNCLACELPTPQEYDILLGEPTAARGDEEKTKSREKINSLEGVKPDERWAFWRNEFSRCIRCYACRNVCPACFCERCFVEEAEPPWVLPIPRWQDNLVFQVTRNIHVAGRCTDCGECDRACPVRIPLRSLAREMYDIVGGLFSYRAGTDKEVPPLLTCYEPTDVEDFIR
jgi:formate dehydrogenase subunit beta